MDDHNKLEVSKINTVGKHINFLMEKETKLTPLYIKTVSQKFDILTIFLLDLSNKGIN